MKYFRILLIMFVFSACAVTAEEDMESIVLTGFLEQRSYHLNSEVPGTIEEVLVEEGEAIAAGQVLLQIRNEAYSFELDAASAQVQAAEIRLQELQTPDQTAIQKARLELEAAQAQHVQARAALAVLEQQYSPYDPPDLGWHAAQGAIEIAAAGIVLAEAQLAQVLSLPDEHELELAQAQLDQAQAQFELAQYYQRQLQPYSPLDAQVEQVLVHSGEIVQPGTLIAMLSDTTDLRVTVYASALQVAGIFIGSDVTITSDAFPGQTFSGKVIGIADEAQFTPSNVQTRAERVKLVFAVEIAVEGNLFGGTPVDVWLE